MARQSLRKAERIRSSADFSRVFQKGRAHGGKRLVLFYLKTEGHGPSVGFTTTRQVRSAVRRNRAKRLMREAYRRVKYGIQGEGMWLVFLARGDTRDMTLENVRGEMVELFTQACLWRG